MKRQIILLWSTLVFNGMIICSPVQAGQFVDLTGTYSCDDGGIYYVRTMGDEMFWYGKGKGWANVFYGKFKAPNKYVGRWADVPSGNLRNFGSLTIRRQPNPSFLVRESNTGPFGGTKWTKTEIKIKQTDKKLKIK